MIPTNPSLLLNNLSFFSSEKEIKVVIVGQDPYPTKNFVVNGIPFACPKNSVQPSLKYIIREIARTYDVNYEDFEKSFDTSLVSWIKQGVLLYNVNLTCEVGKPGIHSDIWKVFSHIFLKKLSDDIFDPFSYNPVVFVFMGKVAQSFKDAVNPNIHKIIQCSHPAIGCYTEEKSFVGSNVFSEINSILIENQQNAIKW